jgi:phosphatidylserine decarboxylase
MLTLILQLAVLCVLAVALVMLAVCFPYPSPIVRPWLPARKRWPETQIRRWLAAGRFQRGYLRYFYRDPKRLPDAPNGLLAPADGLVTSADVRDDIRYVVIALSFWDMHVQRSPLDGTVVAADASGDTFTDGEGREFAFLRAKRCPVQQRLVIRTGMGDIAIRLITSVAARRIEAFVHVGDTVARGQRIGRILLGSTVVLELPAGTLLAVPVGSRVWAGQTVIAAEGPQP